MYYQKELHFLLNFFENHKINTHFYRHEKDLSFLDHHIRDILGDEQEYALIENFISTHIHPNTIYKIVDQFSCIYFILPLPYEKELVPFIIGPYTQNKFDIDHAVQQIQKHKLTPPIFQKIQEQFAKIPILWDDTSIQTILQTFGEIIWEKNEKFTLKILDYQLEETPFTHYPTAIANEVFSRFDTQIYEAFLTQENHLIHAVSQGNLQTAEEVLSTLFAFPFTDASHDVLRNMKNYAISLNSIFMKTVQLNIVNSYDVLPVSTRFIKKIELCTSPKSCTTLVREMVRKYCLLIKNHTMKDYSPLIQQAIKQINLDLSADLSLHTIADKLNSNPSYLSTQFKKITGSTYTEYVQRKRIEHAILLLNTTSLQIQTIAQYCGIPDLNYFSKLFKKYVHYSPSAYRKEISKHES